MKVIAFDLDGVLCDRPKNIEHLKQDKYKYCTPIYSNIAIVNNLYDSGFYIKIYTARGMTTFANNKSLIYNNLFIITKNFLDEHGVKYHELVMAKEHYDLLIDDKALNSNNITINSIKDFLK
jgi:hypothetical protein